MVTQDALDLVQRALVTALRLGPGDRTAEEMELVHHYLNAPSRVFGEGSDAALRHARIQWIREILGESP